MDYVDRLTALRQDRDIEQKEIAAVFGCQEIAISKNEKGRAEKNKQGNNFPLRL